MYGEISSGVTSILFLAAAGCCFHQMRGTTSSAIITICALNAMICVQPKFSSFVQMSLTLTGWIPGGRGGFFVGEKNSLRRYPNPPKFVPQFTANRLFIGPFGTGFDLKKSFRFSLNPPPYSFGIKVECTFGLTLIGFSVRNCLRFDQNPSVTTCCGVLNLGTAEAGTGRASWTEGSVTSGLFIPGGMRSIKLLGTCSPNSPLPL